MFERLIPNASACYQFRAEGALQQSVVATQMGFTPDIQSNVEVTAQGNRLIRASANHSVCPLNIMGFIPGVSTLSGTYRTLVGLAYLIKCVACNIFDKANRTQHQEGIKIAAANIRRGLLEIIPIVGNIIVGISDASRIWRRWEEVLNSYERDDYDY